MPTPPSISVTTEQLPKSQVGMTIEVPADAVDATYERVLNRPASRAKLEGFRPGRAPRALVEARLGPAAIREEVVETIVPEVIRQALEEKSINPIDNPDVEVVELERGRPAKLKATVSVMPEVKLGDAKALDVAPPTVEVTNEMLERRLDVVREPMAEITPVEREQRPADVVVTDGAAEEEGVVKGGGGGWTVGVPETLVEREVGSHLDSLNRSLNSQGLRLDRYLEYLGKTPEQWIAEERPEAEQHVKRDLVLDEFGRREHIEPSDEEVNAYIEREAADDDELKGQADELKRGPNSRRFFSARLRRLRVLERLAELAGDVKPAAT